MPRSRRPGIVGEANLTTSGCDLSQGSVPGPPKTFFSPTSTTKPPTPAKRSRRPGSVGAATRTNLGRDLSQVRSVSPSKARSSPASTTKPPTSAKRSRRPGSVGEANSTKLGRDLSQARTLPLTSKPPTSQIPTKVRRSRPLHKGRENHHQPNTAINSSKVNSNISCRLHAQIFITNINISSTFGLTAHFYNDTTTNQKPTKTCYFGDKAWPFKSHGNNVKRIAVHVRTCCRPNNYMYPQNQSQNQKNLLSSILDWCFLPSTSILASLDFPVGLSKNLTFFNPKLPLGTSISSLSNTALLFYADITNTASTNIFSLCNKLTTSGIGCVFSLQKSRIVYTFVHSYLNSHQPAGRNSVHSLLHFCLTKQNFSKFFFSKNKSVQKSQELLLEILNLESFSSQPPKGIENG